MVDWRCRESEGKVKIEGYMSISDEEAHDIQTLTMQIDPALTKDDLQSTNGFLESGSGSDTQVSGDEVYESTDNLLI